MDQALDKPSPPCSGALSHFGTPNGSPAIRPSRNDRNLRRDSTRGKCRSSRAASLSNPARHWSGSALGHAATGRSSRVHTTRDDHRWPLHVRAHHAEDADPATHRPPTRPKRSQKSGWSTNKVLLGLGEPTPVMALPPRRTTQRTRREFVRTVAVVATMGPGSCQGSGTPDLHRAILDLADSTSPVQGPIHLDL